MFVSLQQRLKMGQQNITQPTSLPAPVGGWNTRDELDAMDALDAVAMDNFFPDSQGVKVRGGDTSHATGLGGSAVESLMEFQAGAVHKLLGACAGSIFDVSASGAVGAAIKSGFTSNRWQVTNFLNRMFLVNGADTMQTYDGTTMADATFTGVTLSTLVGVVQYQQRLFFWQNNGVGVWYAQLNSITGALAFFDLSVFMPRGGTLIAATTITHDGGNGVLDFIAFIFSSGDVILYLGNDPSLAAGFQMIGRYRISPPVSPRAVCTYGGDSYLTTFDDYLGLQAQLAALKAGALPPRSKASGAVQAAILANPSGFGWQALYYPARRALIFNVPNADGTFDQHVCNTSLPNTPWCRFQGLNASCWSLFGNGLYYGGAGGVVYQADVSDTDNAGNPITATAQQAWNKINIPSGKRISAVRPIVQSTEGSFNFAIGYDYDPLSIQTPQDLVGLAITDDSGVAITDDSGVAITSGAAGISPRWHAAGGVGTAFSFGMQVLSAGQTSWLRTDLRYEQTQGL